MLLSLDMPEAPPEKPSDWPRVRDILHRALELPAQSRKAFIEEACGGDAELRAEVESLLAASDRSAFFDNPAIHASSDSIAGRRIGHYQVLEKLGEGGMGIVYKAIDTRLDREVALKVLPPGRENWKREHRFAREAKAASALNHPNIVTIYEFDSQDGLNFFSMEYVPGATLQQVLHDRTAPLPTLLEYARQAAGAIARAHQAGIVHRDLKPGNIMITQEGVAKVLDFGLAKRSADSAHDETQTVLTVAGQVLGTPAYMSPEQAKGEDEDPRSDIFSFGVILYEIACGRRPFEGKDAHTIMHQITHVEPPPPATLNPSIPPELAALIKWCTKKDAQERPASMVEVASALSSIVQGQPVSIRRRKNARGKWLAIAAAAGVLAIASVAALWIGSRKTAVPVISYTLEAQQMRNGEPLGEPYTASPSDTFEGGWKFRVRVRPAQTGFVYLINEGPGNSGTSRYWVLYPEQASGAPVKANADVTTGWYVFDQNPGTEKLWIVWAERAVQPLEEVLRRGALGEVKDPDLAARIQQIVARLGKPGSEVSGRAAEGVLGSAIELRHR